MNISHIYIDNYKIDLNFELGKGTFSSVYKCYDISNTSFAVKIIDKINKIKIKKMTLNEICILKLLKSPYIINFIDFTELDDKYYIFLELAELKLYDLLLNIRIHDILQYVKQLIKGLIYIQSLNVVHNDIKPANILVNNNIENKLKLCDFGMSAEMDNNHDFFCGSPIYMNLDRLEGNYKSNSDFWAIKIIYYYMIYNKHPFEGAQTIKQLISMIKCGVSIPYHIDIHTNILKDLFNNVINTPHELLTRLELYENNFIDNNDFLPNINRKPIQDYSIYINISSIWDDTSYFKEEKHYQKLIDKEFSEYLLLE